MEGFIQNDPVIVPRATVPADGQSDVPVVYPENLEKHIKLILFTNQKRIRHISRVSVGHILSADDGILWIPIEPETAINRFDTTYADGKDAVVRLVETDWKKTS